MLQCHPNCRDFSRKDTRCHTLSHNFCCAPQIQLHPFSVAYRLVIVASSLEATLGYMLLSTDASASLIVSSISGTETSLFIYLLESELGLKFLHILSEFNLFRVSSRSLKGCLAMLVKYGNQISIIEGHTSFRQRRNATEKSKAIVRRRRLH
jgi:uncharacterized membrane protein